MMMSVSKFGNIFWKSGFKTDGLQDYWIAGLLDYLSIGLFKKWFWIWNPFGKVSLPNERISFQNVEIYFQLLELCFPSLGLGLIGYMTAWLLDCWATGVLDYLINEFESEIHLVRILYQMGMHVSKSGNIFWKSGFKTDGLQDYWIAGLFEYWII